MCESQRLSQKEIVLCPTWGLFVEPLNLGQLTIRVSKAMVDNGKRCMHRDGVPEIPRTLKLYRRFRHLATMHIQMSTQKCQVSFLYANSLCLLK